MTDNQTDRIGVPIDLRDTHYLTGGQWVEKSEVSLDELEDMMNLYPGLRIAQSKIPNAGLGVFTLSPIPKETFLGVYKGELKSIQPKNSSLTFEIPDFDDLTGEINLDRPIAWVDALELTKSNWTRFMNTSLTPDKANVGIAYDRYNVRFTTNRKIRSGEELLIYYGDDYIKDLLARLKIDK